MAALNGQLIALIITLQKALSWYDMVRISLICQSTTCPEIKGLRSHEFITKQENIALGFYNTVEQLSYFMVLVSCGRFNFHWFALNSINKSYCTTQKAIHAVQCNQFIRSFQSWINRELWKNLVKINIETTKICMHVLILELKGLFWKAWWNNIYIYIKVYVINIKISVIVKFFTK